MGVEIDLRSRNQKIILHHDPFKSGESFETFLKNYRHSFLILNVKEEGLEEPALELLQRYKIREYFFLDLSFPALMKLVREGIKNVAVRFSEYEPVEAAMALKGKADWLWIDCFDRFPLNHNTCEILRNEFKLCVVSPELQGHPIEQIDLFREQMKHFAIDAICTKYPGKWES